ncbi:MAG TPA: hypothetical protein VJ063_09370 [Verrucomicrobiae bacterium]|nr:hypothetical protein [Verrucomicrobiae bacterium]
MKARAMIMTLCALQACLFVFLVFTLPEPAGHLKAAARTAQDLLKADTGSNAETMQKHVAAAFDGYRVFVRIWIVSTFATISVLFVFLLHEPSPKQNVSRTASEPCANQAAEKQRA